ncbi:MAG: hypothetical protein RDU25_03030 [Patescibacteria group bacterium]|nr:hypothetical protein [Patescibacteria group bacterium]
MKKTYLFTVAALSGIILFGGGCFGDKPIATTEEGSKRQEAPPAQEEKTGLFQSIKDAFDRSVAIRCEYTNEDGEKITTYIKNKKIYLETQPKLDKNGEEAPLVKGIATNDTMYVWTVGNKQGLSIDLREATEPATIAGTEVRSTEDIIDQLEKKKESCKPDSIPDSKFDLPSDVEFKSLSDMMKAFENK